MKFLVGDIFSFLCSTIEEFKPDLIIGSSMGGYSAFILGADEFVPKPGRLSELFAHFKAV